MWVIELPNNLLICWRPFFQLRRLNCRHKRWHTTNKCIHLQFDKAKFHMPSVKFAILFSISEVLRSKLVKFENPKHTPRVKCHLVSAETPSAAAISSPALRDAWFWATPRCPWHPFWFPPKIRVFVFPCEFGCTDEKGWAGDCKFHVHSMEFDKKTMWNFRGYWKSELKFPAEREFYFQNAKSF